MVPNVAFRSNVPWFVLVVLSFSVFASAEEYAFTAMSFNIRYGAADDGPNSWEHRKELVADVIRDYAPDVAGTQETLDFQAEYLGEMLPDYDHFGMGRDTRNQGERMELFYRRDSLHPVETGHFWLSKTPDVPATRSWRSSLNRMVTWAKFYHFDSKALIYVFNTHFDHRSAEARAESAALLRERVEALDPAFPVVVLGDFNAIAESGRPYETLLEGRLRDARLQARDVTGPEGTGSGFQPEGRSVIPRIDWILYAGPLEPVRFETIDRSADGRYPSDHYPIVATFTWTVDEAMQARLRSGTRK